VAATYRCEPLGPSHDRAAFSCGNNSLDDYFRTRAGQDRKRGVASPYVLVEIATGLVAGYYTLATTGVLTTALPPEIAQRLPRYPVMPAMLLGRLARDLRFRGRGVGDLLLSNALRHCLRLSEEIASVGVVVDAIDDDARAFYERYGFSRFPDDAHRLIIPMATVARLMGEGRSSSK
jgi:GNAT superfamily N-acetyltransferase